MNPEEGVKDERKKTAETRMAVSGGRIGLDRGGSACGLCF